jgi:hypothetical protein
MMSRPVTTTMNADTFSRLDSDIRGQKSRADRDAKPRRILGDESDFENPMAETDGRA